jgi:ATP-binding cassette, subfamily C, bacterial
MPQGLDSIVGERGSLVSGGERQRLALARALLRMPRLLILDEGTNAIDIASERQILTQLMDLTPRPTIIMIAHRSESLVFCDQVFTLRRGKLVEG